ncbi:TPA: hypothetical protein DDZ10_04515 [Candidatus Uhrbacteria bacterium]|nr:MAG: hypothetical protein UY79_C0005G0034 [Parcubacteria group bacterium GW2011_GWA2_53_21]HBL39898.1 hypothetical protein [Candidatus Uhrbacteria bacterium]
MYPQTLIKKINRLESAIQELKTEFYFTSLQKKPLSKYAQSALMRAAKQLREDLWQKRYAKKIKDLS